MGAFFRQELAATGATSTFFSSTRRTASADFFPESAHFA
jgi:hypothetical protein